MGRKESRGGEPYTLGKGIVEGQTDLAIRVRITEPGVESLRPDDMLWIPQSVVHDDSECYGLKDGNKGTVVVLAWWAEKNGHDV